MKKRANARRARILERIHRARTLFHVNTALWLAMGAWFVWQMVEDGNGLAAAYVFLFFLIAALVLQAGVKFLERRERWVFAASIAAAALNLILTFFGFPGPGFILALSLDVAILLILFPLKAYYLTRHEADS